jgi:hypothetical protein
MYINRTNYEQYFLLYADNELSASDKELVEAFLRGNIDLKDEFLIIQATVSSPDEAIRINDKSFLLKKEASLITESNYEEFFILYYDDELTNEQRKETERFAEQNIKFKTEFELIGKSKLAPDNALIYPWEKQLYKREKRGTIIQPIWMKTVAAAILIGFGLWIAVSYFNKSNTTPRLSTLTNNTPNQAVTTRPVQNKTSNTEKRGEKIGGSSDLFNTAEKLKKNETEIKKTDFNKQETKDKLIAIEKEKTEDEIVIPDLIENKSHADLQLATLDKITEELPILVVTENDLQSAQIAKQQYEIDSEASHTSPVQTASYISSNSNDQDYVFYDISIEDFRKSKIGEIFKKVKRVVERNNPIAHLFAGGEGQFASKN